MILMHSGSTNLCRSVSSVGEHESATYTTPPLPKRAETFSGFESKDKDKGELLEINGYFLGGFAAQLPYYASKWYSCWD